MLNKPSYAHFLNSVRLEMQSRRVLVLLSALLVVQTKDLMECEQTVGETYIQCREIEQLKQVAFYIQADWQHVKIVNAHRGLEIDGQRLSQLSSLTSLDLSGAGGLMLWEQGSFRDLTRLQQLNLSHCQLEELQAKHFADNASLVNLDASHNDLQFIGRTLMRQLPNLVYANFSNNNIANVQPDAFKDLEYLLWLDLNTNEQENITIGSNANLRYLSISNNNVRDVSAHEERGRERERGGKGN